MIFPGSSILRETVTMLLAGGQGERLYPLTAFRSKPAVPESRRDQAQDGEGSLALLAGLYGNRPDCAHLPAARRRRQETLSRDP